MNALRRLRREHPIFFWGMAVLILSFVGATATVAMRVPEYIRETRALERELSTAERATRDRILAARSEQKSLALAMVQREVRLKSIGQKGLHLAIDLQDSALVLRHGSATLRRVPIRIGPDSVIRGPGDQTWRFIRPLGERTIVEKQVSPEYTIPEWVYVSRGEAVPPVAERTTKGALGRYVLRLDDGNEIYSEPEGGPFAGQPKPASFMASERDLQAFFDAVKTETPVFIY